MRDGIRPPSAPLSPFMVQGTRVQRKVHHQCLSKAGVQPLLGLGGLAAGPCMLSEDEQEEA